MGRTGGIKFAKHAPEQHDVPATKHSSFNVLDDWLKCFYPNHCEWEI